MRLLCIRTVRTGPIKTLLDALKDILVDVNIQFRKSIPKKKKDEEEEEVEEVKKHHKKKTKKKDDDEISIDEESSEKKNKKDKKKKKHKNDDEEDESNVILTENDEKCDHELDGDKKKDDTGGMVIQAINNYNTVLIYLKLKANKFDYYECRKNLTLGVNILNWYKLIKDMDNKADVLTLYYDDDDPNNLSMKIENKQTTSTHKLKLMEIEPQKKRFPPTKFDFVLTMPSAAFYKTCHSMHNVGDFVELKAVGKQLIFSACGDVGSSSIIYKDTKKGVRIKTDCDKNIMVQGIFDSKNLVTFTKCTALCQSVDIYIKDDEPLVVKYQVAGLGHIYFFLAPVHNTNENAQIEDDEIGDTTEKK